MLLTGHTTGDEMIKICRKLGDVEAAKLDTSLIPEDNTLYILAEPNAGFGMCLSQSASGDPPLFVEIIPHIVGPSDLYLNKKGVFRITNFSSLLKGVSIQSNSGLSEITGGDMASLYENGGYFSYTPLAASSDGFTVNNRLTRVNTLSASIEAPMIISPDKNSSVDPLNFVLDASNFVVNGSQAQWDLHSMTDWEISTDPNFENIVWSSYENTQDLTSIRIGLRLD